MGNLFTEKKTDMWTLKWHSKFFRSHYSRNSLVIHSILFQFNAFFAYLPIACLTILIIMILRLPGAVKYTQAFWSFNVTKLKSPSVRNRRQGELISCTTWLVHKLVPPSLLFTIFSGLARCSRRHLSLSFVGDPWLKFYFFAWKFPRWHTHRRCDSLFFGFHKQCLLRFLCFRIKRKLAVQGGD